MGVAEVLEKIAPGGRWSNSPLLCELSNITASSQCLFVNWKINHSTGRSVTKEQLGGTPPPHPMIVPRVKGGTAGGMRHRVETVVPSSGVWGPAQLVVVLSALPHPLRIFSITAAS